jgi:hypothetical protein
MYKTKVSFKVASVLFPVIPNSLIIYRSVIFLKGNIELKMTNMTSIFFFTFTASCFVSHHFQAFYHFVYASW